VYTCKKCSCRLKILE